jgi:hypothetical protein
MFATVNKHTITGTSEAIFSMGSLPKLCCSEDEQGSELQGVCVCKGETVSESEPAETPRVRKSPVSGRHVFLLKKRPHFKHVKALGKNKDAPKEDVLYWGWPVEFYWTRVKLRRLGNKRSRMAVCRFS